MTPRRLFIRFLTPWIWRRSPVRKLEALQEFAIIEHDSGCQILKAIDSIPDPRVKAMFFQQVLEEFHHYDLFDGACRALAPAPLPVPIMTREELLPESAGPSEVLDFLSYLHVGEREVNKDFAVYAEAAVDEEAARVFRAVRMDEEHHEEDSLELLRSLVAGDDRAVRRSVAKALLLRWWRTYAGAMKEVGKLPLFALLGALYFAAGPLLARAFRRRLALPAAEQLEIFSRRAASPSPARG